mmetsp:Transcript_15603/g.51246  ORF Transcript_15603/g.51246 Transcript_15603/m.51246 type:complete len:251 (+) Transcript_15603:560-1312(+)
MEELELFEKVRDEAEVGAREAAVLEVLRALAGAERLARLRDLEQDCGGAVRVHVLAERGAEDGSADGSRRLREALQQLEQRRARARKGFAKRQGGEGVLVDAPHLGPEQRALKVHCAPARVHAPRTRRHPSREDVEARARVPFRHDNLARRIRVLPERHAHPLHKGDGRLLEAPELAHDAREGDERNLRAQPRREQPEQVLVRVHRRLRALVADVGAQLRSQRQRHVVLLHEAVELVHSLVERLRLLPHA